MMCNGGTLDELLFDIHGLIARFGCAVIPVGDRLPSTWAYTIGLVEVNHAELTVNRMPPEAAGRLLNHLGVLIRSGRKFVDGEEITVGTGRYRFASVPDRQLLNGRFAIWVNYYGALGPPHPEPRFLEVVSQDQARRASHDFARSRKGGETHASPGFRRGSLPLPASRCESSSCCLQRRPVTCRSDGFPAGRSKTV
jgi:hypothetical protein